MFREVKARMELLALLDRAMVLFSGSWSKTLCWLAGKELGKEENVSGEGVEEVLKNVHTWEIKLYEKKSDSEYIVVFQKCPIRKTHYTVCTEQGGSLCITSHGYIAQIISNSLKKNASLHLIHAGPNACLKRLVIE